MRRRSLLPVASIALAGIAAFVLYNLRAPERSFSTSTRLPRYAIAGRIVTSTGAPPREMMVWATVGTTSAGVPVQADGTFTRLTLEPGTYVLSTGRAGDPTASATAIEGGFTIVNVGEGDVPDVTINTKPTVNVPARIRYVRLDPQAGTPQVVLHARLRVKGFEGGHGITAVGRPDGSVVLYDVYGPRVIDYGWSAGESGGWRPTAVLLNGNDITGKPVDFTAVPNPELEVVFAQRR